MIPRETYEEALAIIEAYKVQEEKRKIIDALNSLLLDGQKLEYRDMGGQWYAYTQELQDNPYFRPIKLRIKNV